MYNAQHPHAHVLHSCCSSVSQSLIPISLGNTPSQADVSRLQIELESFKAEATTERHRSKAEMEEAQRIIKETTIERDELRVKIELLKNVNGK